MHHILSNHFIVILASCSLCLQGCRSGWQITPGGLVPEESRRTSDDAQAPGQEPALDVLSSAFSGGHAGGLPSACPVTLVSAATSAVQLASSTRYFAVKPDAGPSRRQASPMEFEGIDTKPAAKPTLAFGAREWRQYFGEIGVAPPLPSDINQILHSACPFWSGKQVRDTHLLVLIPARVASKPFSLNLLGELIRFPQGGGHPTEYRGYTPSSTQEQFGAQSPEGSYWVLMTRDVLEGSRSKRYASQQALVAYHASRTGLPYELPGLLEVATAILSHYVRSGERLYPDASWTYTRCRELVSDQYPAVVGKFSPEGLVVGHHDFVVPTKRSGVAALLKFKEIDTGPAASPTLIFGAREWRQYFGEVGVAPPLPSDIDKILDDSCPFWPGKLVKDTHLLVLIPSTVDGRAFTLDLLGELIKTPRGDGHRTQYFLYDDGIQQSSGDVCSSSSYWVLLTRDVLSGSSNKPYEVQQALVAQQSSHIDHPPYEIPSVLEVATAILSYYVLSGHRLYEGTDGVSPSTSTRCTVLLEDTAEYPSPIAVGRFCSRGLVFLSGFDDDVEFGVSCLRQFGTRSYRPSALLHSFGAEDWRHYLGKVEETPLLPMNILDTLNSACPFWPGRQVKDTHLLVLIPATVNGEPFSLNLLEKLIQRPQGGGYPAKYVAYASAVREQFGTQSPGASYWVLMMRDVLEGSRDKDYAFQQALVAHHASRIGLPYELPSTLEAATAILSHYVRSGERLYTDDPWTYARCQELVAWGGGNSPAIVGGFSSGGIGVDLSVGRSSHGVAGLRKL